MIDISNESRDTFDKEGVVIIPNVLDQLEIENLKSELVAAIDQDLHDRPDVFDKGMVHNCMTRGNSLAQILDCKLMNKYVCSILGETCILYAYQSSSLPPFGKSNYGRRLHIDCPRFIPGYTTNVGVIFPLTDFTEENGATHYLKGSHLSDNCPSEEFFEANATRAVCRAGDMIFINARVYHRSGVNHSEIYRHAITLNFCRSYMRQRFDYPRLVPQSIIDSLGKDGKRLIGMNVRMPTSLDEFYLPEEDRLYKPNQG